MTLIFLHFQLSSLGAPGSQLPSIKQTTLKSQLNALPLFTEPLLVCPHGRTHFMDLLHAGKTGKMQCSFAELISRESFAT